MRITPISQLSIFMLFFSALNPVYCVEQGKDTIQKTFIHYDPQLFNTNFNKFINVMEKIIHDEIKNKDGVKNDDEKTCKHKESLKLLLDHVIKPIKQEVLGKTVIWELFDSIIRKYNPDHNNENSNTSIAPEEYFPQEDSHQEDSHQEDSHQEDSSEEEDYIRDACFYTRYLLADKLSKIINVRLDAVECNITKKKDETINKNDVHVMEDAKKSKADIDKLLNVFETYELADSETIREELSYESNFKSKDLRQKALTLFETHNVMELLKQEKARFRTDEHTEHLMLIHECLDAFLVDDDGALDEVRDHLNNQIHEIIQCNELIKQTFEKDRTIEKECYTKKRCHSQAFPKPEQ